MNAKVQSAPKLACNYSRYELMHRLFGPRNEAYLSVIGPDRRLYLNAIIRGIEREDGSGNSLIVTVQIENAVHRICHRCPF